MVNLIGITKPSAYTDCHTAGELVAFAARVSNPANQSNTKTAPKLLKYLIKENHWSPFEMVHIVMEINTTRDISRQILRHRSFAFQEFSQRYAVSNEFVGYPGREARIQHPKNRQLSMVFDDTEKQNEAQRIFSGLQGDVLNKAKDLTLNFVRVSLSHQLRRSPLVKTYKEKIIEIHYTKWNVYLIYLFYYYYLTL